jgi:succinyl-diaminopimelate desuccinylase
MTAAATPFVLDPVALARALIVRPSVTPADAGALDVLQQALEALGFACWRLPFQAPGTPDIDNLYARLGTGGRHLCFAGHTDVVPVGDATAWTVDPFGGVIEGGRLFGRGASDMKGAIAAFVAAVADVTSGGPLDGSLSLLITGDEEGPAINGTVKVLDWMAARGERPDACLVGEPTNPTALGEMIKIGRRGSVNFRLEVTGAQGHAAYPHLADNPIPRMVRILAALDAWVLDTGTAHFQPSSLVVTSVDVGNAATNVIPARASAAFNVRFNDLHTARSLEERVRAIATEVCGEAGSWSLKVQVTGEAFLTPPGPFNGLIADACEAVLGRRPEFSTTGGTSDARFIHSVCPVAEFGLVGQTMHKVDENAAVADIEALTRIYAAVIRGFMAPEPA